MLEHYEFLAEFPAIAEWLLRVLDIFMEQDKLDGVQLLMSRALNVAKSIHKRRSCGATPVQP